MNTNNTDAFDLDNYFLDNETLTYTSSAVGDITVIINETTNIVSFYPDYNFQGTRTVVFTAHDALNATENSNTVTLNITPDITPPEWSNPSKNNNNITQNTVVTFSATWQDNIALDRFIFSIKQEAGWINQSSVTFTGIQNTSSYAIQISAPAGIAVYWRFYAFDSSGNMNVTDSQNFTVSSLPSPPSQSQSPSTGDDTTSTADSAADSATKSKKRVSDFTIDPSEQFKIDLKQGSTSTITIKITNIGNVNLSFEVEIQGLDEFKKIISGSNFTLSPGKSKTVTIEFSADKRLRPDLYYGIIKVKTPSFGKELPIVLVVKPIETELDLNVEILEDYKNVRPDNIVKADIILKNLKDIERRNVSLYYAITDFRGEIIDSKHEAFIFSSGLASFERNLSVPEKIKKGEYIFFARAVSGKEIIIDSDLFEVGEKFSLAGFIEANFLIILILFSSLILAILMMRYQKNKERLRLLNLYLMITEMKKLMKENKMEDAISIYLRIKSSYGEPLSETAIKNKEELKKEMEKLSKDTNIRLVEKSLEEANQEKKSGEKPDRESGKNTGEETGEKSSEKTSDTEERAEENKEGKENKESSQKGKPEENKETGKEKQDGKKKGEGNTETRKFKKTEQEIKNESVKKEPAKKEETKEIKKIKETGVKADIKNKEKIPKDKKENER